MVATALGAGLPEASLAVPAARAMLAEPLPRMLLMVTLRALVPSPCTLTLPVTLPLVARVTSSG